MKPWIVYTRVSTDDQAETGASLPAQERACRTLLQAHEHEPVQLHSDPGASGKNLKRPAMLRVVAAIEAEQVAGVCAYALDRLTRSLTDLLYLVQLCKAHRVDLLLVREKIDTSGPMGMFILHIMASVAQLEREMTVHRVSTAMAHIKSRGGYLGRAPAGCIAVRGDDNLRRLQPHPEHGAHVAPLWHLAAEGATLMQLVQRLNDDSITTTLGRRWSKTSVYHLLRSESVVGVLVDRATWKRAHAALSANSGRKRNEPGARPRRNPAAAGTWPLAGYCWCGHCGAAMVVAQSKGTGGTYYYLRCSGRLKHGASSCASTGLPYIEVERVIIEGIASRLRNGDIGRAYQAWIVKRQAIADRAGPLILAKQRERERATAGRDRLVTMAEKGGAAARAVEGRLAEVQRQVELLDAELEGLRVAADTVAVEKAGAEAQVERLRDGLPRAAQAGPAERAELFAGIVGRIKLTRDAADIELALPRDECAGPSSLVLPTGRPAHPPTVAFRLRWSRQGGSR